MCGGWDVFASIRLKKDACRQAVWDLSSLRSVDIWVLKGVFCCTVSIQSCRQEAGDVCFHVGNLQWGGGGRRSSVSADARELSISRVNCYGYLMFLNLHLKGTLMPLEIMVEIKITAHIPPLPPPTCACTPSKGWKQQENVSHTSPPHTVLFNRQHIYKRSRAEVVLLLVVLRFIILSAIVLITSILCLCHLSIILSGNIDRPLLNFHLQSTVSDCDDLNIYQQSWNSRFSLESCFVIWSFNFFAVTVSVCWSSATKADSFQCM